MANSTVRELAITTTVTWNEALVLAMQNGIGLLTCAEMQAAAVGQGITSDLWMPARRIDGGTNEWCQIGVHTDSPGMVYFSHTD